MHPILFNIGPLTIHTYGVMMVIAFFACTGLASMAAKRLPKELVAISGDQLVDFSSISLLSGVLGGRIYFVIQHWSFYVSNPFEFFAIWNGGLVWYGGFAGGLLGGFLYTRAKGLSFVRVLDQFIPFVAFGHAIGRVGCFLNGCCYGDESTLWCAVTFPGHDHSVLPTQLFEAAGLVIIGLYLYRLFPEGLRPKGFILGRYMMGYGLLRFGMEFLRGDQSILAVGLTLAQFISLVLVLLGILLTTRIRANAHTR